ncbi:hypothetical protein SAMN05216349_12355 [Oribacterium sp. KHPX15]|uniref:hypothetical protein n=1 Tax=Oribacterium sp. KHPX15 TaxID=1855342 RepID=UPI000896EF10|nr:hypothetical protein [Oribacterium sp. KHPX15]SEA70293.1 hypothetical protein SAMN05216349_12355 [Oribacterium sp. KHPX15]
MNILNIHGYAGSAENTNFSILKEAGYTVISFEIDYDSCSATFKEQLVEDYRRCAKNSTSFFLLCTKEQTERARYEGLFREKHR